MSRLAATLATALALMGLVQPCAASPFDQDRATNSSVEISRGFSRVGYGQLHFRKAQPVLHENIVHRPVLCFHQTPNSSQIYIELLDQLATDRVVYAIDTPGHGESDLPPRPPEIGDYAQAMAEFIQRMGLKEVDLIGYHTGASIAVELARRDDTRVEHLMLVGLALFHEQERQAFFAQPWPRPISRDGSHLVTEWQRSHQWRGAGQSDASVIRTFVQKLQAGDKAWWGARAVMRHDLAAALAGLKTPTVVVNSADDLLKITPRVTALRADFELITLDQWGFGLFEVEPARMAELARNRFDRP